MKKLKGIWLFIATIILIIILFLIKAVAMESALAEVNQQITELESKISQVELLKSQTHELAEAMRAFNKDNVSKEIQNLQENWDLLERDKTQLNQKLNNCIAQKDFIIEQSNRVKPYTDEELDIMSRVIYAEAGSDWISDEQQQLVGMVVMNRVKDSRFPNTIKEVVFQKGQYACTWDGNFNKTPNKRAIENAKCVLEGKVECPENVIFQAEFKQGKGVYKVFKSKYSTTYFCFG